MNVLIACEESQEVCKAFRAKGHRAFSCDIQECSGGHPEWHIQGDVLPLLNGNCTFQTADTHTHTRRAVGSDNRTSTLYRSRGIRGAAFRTEAEGRQTAEEHSVLHADGPCLVRPRSRGESRLHHVKRMEKTGSDHSAVYVRRARPENDLPLAERSSEADAHGHCRPRRNRWERLFRRCISGHGAGRKRKDHFLERPAHGKNQKQNISRHCKGDG